jgi:hypothetical protein
MPLAFPREPRELDTLVLKHALDMAWDEVEFALARNDLDSARLRAIMAAAVLAGLREGEQDLEHLKDLAIGAIAKTY